MRLYLKPLLLLAFFSFSLLCQAPFAHPDEKGILLTEKIQLKMADVFMEEGEYYRAITEYRKFLILFPILKRQTMLYSRSEWLTSAERNTGRLGSTFPPWEKNIRRADISRRPLTTRA